MSVLTVTNNIDDNINVNFSTRHQPMEVDECNPKTLRRPIDTTVIEETMDIETFSTESEIISLRLKRALIRIDAEKARRRWCLCTAVTLLHGFVELLEKTLTSLGVAERLHHFYSEQQFEFIMKRVRHHVGVLHFSGTTEEVKPAKIWWKRKRDAVLSLEATRLYRSIGVGFGSWKSSRIASAISMLTRMHNEFHIKHSRTTDGPREAIASSERILVVDQALTITYWTVREHHTLR